MNEERLKNLEKVMAQIEKEHGRGTVMRLGEKPNLKVEAISTGSALIDATIGVGGLPRGRITEIYGPESSGKTTLALEVIAQANKQGGLAAFVDVEHALDPLYASNIGVNIEDLIISQPESGEQALEVVEALVRSNAVDVVVLDSVAALVPRAELEGDMGDAHVGLQPRLMSQALRKLTGAISKSNAVVIFINQLREKVGVMWGNPEVTPGGRALKFYSSVRCEIRSAETLKEATEIVGRRTKLKVVKNKVAPPFKECEFDIIWGQGIDKVGALLDLATMQDPPLVVRAGAWYSYKDERLGQGRAAAIESLKSDETLYQSLNSEIAKLASEDKLVMKKI